MLLKNKKSCGCADSRLVHPRLEHKKKKKKKKKITKK